MYVLRRVHAPSPHLCTWWPTWATSILVPAHSGVYFGALLQIYCLSVIIPGSHCFRDAFADPPGCFGPPRHIWLGRILSRIAIHVVHFSVANLETHCFPNFRFGAKTVNFMYSKRYKKTLTQLKYLSTVIYNFRVCGFHGKYFVSFWARSSFINKMLNSWKITVFFF